MLEGHGKTADAADSQLARSRSDLSKKVGSSDLSVSNSHYSAKYEIKGKVEDKTYTSEFKVESKTGWEDIEAKAIRNANGTGLDNYNATFNAEVYIELTKKQKKVLNKKHKEKPTTAGGFEKVSGTSSLEALSKL